MKYPLQSLYHSSPRMPVVAVEMKAYLVLDLSVNDFGGFKKMHCGNPWVHRSGLFQRRAGLRVRATKDVALHAL